MERWRHVTGDNSFAWVREGDNNLWPEQEASSFEDNDGARRQRDRFLAPSDLKQDL